MKNLILLCLLILLGSFAPEAADPVKITWSVGVALIVGFYEVICRAIPTVTNWSLIGKIIDILKWLSEFLNRKKA